jgi:hypothetical protein
MNTSSQNEWAAALERSRERMKDSADFWATRPKGTRESAAAFDNARKYYKTFSDSPDESAGVSGFAVDTQGLSAIGGAAEGKAMGDLGTANQFLAALSQKKNAEAAKENADRQASATRTAANSAATGQIIGGTVAAAGAIGAALI